MIKNKDMIIKKLSSQDILSIYATHSARHFPADELKPVSSIRRMAGEGIYVGYGLYEKKKSDGALLCYAFFTVLPDRKNILLDYFAVMEGNRSRGIGSLFLQYMKNTITDHDGILIETENPDYAADERDRLTRDKRIDFYNRNGAFFTGILAEVFGVHYKILFFPILTTPAQETLSNDFDAIYRYMVSPANYESHIHISII